MSPLTPDHTAPEADAVPRRWPRTPGARRTAVLGGALALAALAALSIQAGNPTPWSPFPAAVVLPLLFVEDLLRPSDALAFAASILAVPLAFLAWTVPLARGRTKIPGRSRVAALVAGGLALAWIAVLGQIAVAYQGAIHVGVVAVANVLFAAGLVMALVRERRRGPSFGTSLAFHLCLFGWLAWGAFPWLGELI